MRVCLLFLLLLLNLKSSSQTERLERMLALTSAQQPDDSLANLYQSISKEYLLRSDYANTKKYADLSLELSQKINYPKGIAGAYQTLGIIALNTGYYDLCVNYLNKALSINQKLRNRSGIAGVLNNLA